MKKKTVLLVDDEAIVRTGLSRKIPWEKLGFKLVGAAENGRQALELLREAAVDVVVTDILMPEVNGLALIEEAQKLPRIPKFVILSGYSEFEFAQKAMHFGVRHYVLKPTRVPELERVLHEVAAEIEREKSDRSRIQAAEETIDGARPLLKHSALKQLISGRCPGDTQRKLVHSCLGIRSDRDSLTLVLLEVGGKGSTFGSDIQLIAERTVGQTCLVGSIESDGYICQLIKAVDREKLPFVLEELCRRVAKLSGVRVIAVYTDPTPPSELPRVYRAALACLRSSFYHGEDRLIHFNENRSGFSREVPPELEAALKETATAARIADSGQARQLLHGALLSAKRIRLDPPLLRTQCIDMLVQLGKDLEADIWKRIQARLPRLAEAQSLAELEAGVRLCLEELTAEIRSLTGNPQQRMVETLKLAVRRQFAERGLSLKKLSRTVVFANEDYLSRLFHKITGQRFSDYLTETRMAEARRLLALFPYMPVAEVARQVGYSGNSQYFSSVFRKSCGLSPTEFRKAGQRTDDPP